MSRNRSMARNHSRRRRRRNSSPNITANVVLSVDDDFVTVNQVIEAMPGQVLFNTPARVITMQRKTLESQLEKVDERFIHVNPRHHAQIVKMNSKYRISDKKTPFDSDLLHGRTENEERSFVNSTST